MNLDDYITKIPDHPKPGVLFRDITSLLADGPAFHEAIDRMAAKVADLDFDVIIGSEARGFIFGTPLAYLLKKPFVLVRKKGKLPRQTVSVEYDLEYGTATLEMHRDAIRPGQRILIVDDQKMNLIVLKAMLKKLGDFDVVMAADGKQALAALEAPDAQAFDMVLTDMWMPELDGAGLVKAIRASEKLKSLPVHVVTADVELVKRHEEVGFTSILLKPITVDTIRPIVCGGESGKAVAP